MGRAERDKGRKGEAEVAELYRTRGLVVRGLEGAGDHLVVCGEHSGVLVHSEVKRQEVARPWQWWEQASAEAPAGSIAVVHFRRNRSPWLALLSAGELVALLEQLENSRAAGEHLRERVGELEHRLDELGEPVA
jgi:hypothetical protein